MTWRRRCEEKASRCSPWRPRLRLKAMDLVGFTLQYELSYTNILNMLDLAGIPLRSEERTENDPLIVAGGPCAFNPEPLADFLDVVMIGDGEALLPELCRRHGLWKKRGESRKAFLLEICRIPGSTSFVLRAYSEAGQYSGTRKIVEEAPDSVLKAILPDLNGSDFPVKISFPYRSGPRSGRGGNFSRAAAGAAASARPA